MKKETLYKIESNIPLPSNMSEETFKTFNTLLNMKEGDCIKNLTTEQKNRFYHVARKHGFKIKCSEQDKGQISSKRRLNRFGWWEDMTRYSLWKMKTSNDFCSVISRSNTIKKYYKDIINGQIKVKGE